MTGATDWTNLGWFPLQDHEDDVPLHIRQMLVGGRIARLGDDTSPQDSLIEYALDDDKGTLGDIHPWLFWQTADRDERGMGSWSMAWAGLTAKDVGSKKKPKTGLGPVAVLPMRDENLTSDPRYILKNPGWPKCFPTLPQGTVVMVMPATEEGEQKEVMLHADPRLFAVHTKGPATHGSLVVDLQPDGEPCMDGSDTPGVGGRAARIQSMMRVIPFEKPTPILGTGEGNSLAWNLALSGVDSLAGYGMVWARLDGGGAGGGGAGGRPRSGDDGSSPCDFGKFSPNRRGGHGVAFMAQVGASGPFHAGHETDKHRIDVDRDGNPMNSGHISINGYFYENQRKDGPLLFEPQEYPHPAPLPLTTRVHLVWDDSLIHPWINGSRQGKWRWYSETTVFGPTTNPPGKKLPPQGPITPGGPRVGSPGSPGPTTPGPGGPITPGGPGVGSPGSPGPTTPGPTGPIPGGPVLRGPETGGPGGQPGGAIDPGGVIEIHPDVPLPWDQLRRALIRGRVGEVDSRDLSLYQAFHPMQEGFTELAFRPQLMVDGYPSFVHNPHAAQSEIADDESVRPQVLAMRSWGAQNDSGEWDYDRKPTKSRARGGVAAGGVLFGPPEFEMEDYLGINTSADVRAFGVAAFLTCAPGASLALGLPNTDGGLEPRSVTIGQDVSADTNDPLRISQLNASRVSTVLFGGELDQDTAEVVVDLGTGGNQAARMPRGTTAQRPSSIAPTGGEFRINTDLSTGLDTPEFYDAQTGLWFPMGGGPLRIPFTATDVFAHRHGRGADPIVQVKVDDHLVEVCVDYPDSDTVVLHFSDTITGGVLLLS